MLSLGVTPLPIPLGRCGATDLQITEPVRGFLPGSAQIEVLLWKAADSPDPPAVDINQGWDKMEGEEVIMAVLDVSPVAPPVLLDIISCGCKAELKSYTAAK